MPCMFGHSLANEESGEALLSPKGGRRKQFSGAIKALLKIAAVKLSFKRSRLEGPKAASSNNVGRPRATLRIREESSGSGRTLNTSPSTEVAGRCMVVQNSFENGIESGIASTSILEPPNIFRNSFENASKCRISQLQLVPTDTLAMGEALSMRLPELGAGSIWMICNPLYFSQMHESMRKQQIGAKRDQNTREISSMVYKSGF